MIETVTGEKVEGAREGFTHALHPTQVKVPGRLSFMNIQSSPTSDTNGLWDEPAACLCYQHMATCVELKMNTRSPKATQAAPSSLAELGTYIQRTRYDAAPS